jgi:hypothetical protein
MGRMNDVRSECSKVSLRALVRAPRVAPVCVLLALSNCGGGKTGAGSAKLPEGTHSEVLDHEDCSDSGHRVESLDTNGDGKPDIRRVFDKGTGKEVCRVVDLNRDGKPDLYEYFDASGAVRRREFCYDETGVVNAIEHYEGGKLARREVDTSGQHRIDTWDWFDPSVPMDAKTGQPKHPSRRERDTTGRGMVDQWWTWEGEKLTIAYDRTGDGKPDPEATIVLSGGDDAGATPPPVATAAPGADAGSAPAAVAREGGAPMASAADGGKT